MLETGRSKIIQKYIAEHPTQKIDGQKMSILYHGTVHNRELWRIPIKYLIHNIRNGRFASELLEKEEQLRRKLDPTKKEDAKIIRQLLLDQNDSETTALEKDIKEHGQLEPGIITFDGAVINANRRMAILSVLHEKTKLDKYAYLTVGILPSGVDELDLWKIEAGLQFGRDFRLQYGGVNELLKLREGEKQGLEASDISIALNGRFTGKQVLSKLAILKLIDSYLAFIEKPGEYHRITEEEKLEKFNSLHNSVISPLTNKHGVDKKEIARLTSIGFSLIEKTDVTHWDIRNLLAISTNPKAITELKSPFISKYPNTSKEIKASKDKLKEAYTAAKEIIENAKEKDKPERLLTRAQSALEGVDETSRKLKESKVIELLGKIKKRVDVLIKASKL